MNLTHGALVVWDTFFMYALSPLGVRPLGESWLVCGRNVGTFFTVIRSGHPRTTILIWSKERLGIRIKKVLLKTLQVKSRVYSEEMGTNILEKYLVTTELNWSWSEWVSGPLHCESFNHRSAHNSKIIPKSMYCNYQDKNSHRWVPSFIYILLLVLYYFEQIKVLRPAQIACFNGCSIIYCSWFHKPIPQFFTPIYVCTAYFTYFS